MNLSISGFTHRGTYRNKNEDSILVNGNLLNSGSIYLPQQNECICFISDGVGGNQAGEFASAFILEKIKEFGDIDFSKLSTSLKEINLELIKVTVNNKSLQGAAATLSGIILKENFFQIYHSGDSQIWLLRNDIFFKITNDQVLDDTEINSPITSYFGGMNNCMKLDPNININESIINDLFLICSDGLFKALTQKTVKFILCSDVDTELKCRMIMDKCLSEGAEDNISVIIIHKTE